MNWTKKCRCLLMLVLMGACSVQAQVNYHISGSWKGGNGEKIYLKQFFSPDSLTMIDSTVVGKGKYEFKGSLPYMMRLELSGKPGKQRVFVDGVNDLIVNVVTKQGERKGKSYTSTTFEPVETPEQHVIEESSQMSMMTTLMKFGNMFAMSKILNDSISTEAEKQHQVDSIQTAYATMDSLLNQNLDSFLVASRDRYAITYFISEFIGKYYSYTDMAKWYNQLTDRVKNSHPGRELKAQVEAMSQVNVGGIAPNITLPTLDGKTLSLYSLRGHVILLDFWASWCGPCLAEMPNVKNIYAKYHSKGLEIFGVSLDDKGDKWRNAIAKHELNWNHVSSLKGWNCPVAKEYNVTAIPRMYIIDPTGRIIAQDLRGEALVKKMDELFTGKK